MSRSHIQFAGVLALLALLAAAAHAQIEDITQSGTTAEPAVVTSVRMVHEGNSPAIEVVSTHPLVPTIQPLDSPPRLVIDLSNARTGLQQKKIRVLQENILTIRTEQYRKDPPVMRIVVDLLVPHGYTWDAAGNRLMVRLKLPENANASKSGASAPQVLSTAPSEAPAFVPVTSGVGDVVLAGRQFAAGSSLTAGSETTVLRLARGGEVHVCPGTTLSVTPSKNSQDLMLGMSTGALEMHYSLSASADTVLTPDFRILFSGPGEFHYAVSSDSHGNTCVRGLSGNRSSAVVSELIGDRVYNVKPSEQAVFHTGRIDKVDSDVPLECGCPPPVPVMRTDATPARVIPDSNSQENITLAQNSAGSASTAKPENDSGASDPGQTLSNGPETRPLPASQPGDVHITVDAPMVFQGKTSAPIPAAPTDEASTLPVMASSSRPIEPQAQVQPPPAQSSGPEPQHRGVLRRIKGFFGAIFH